MRNMLKKVSWLLLIAYIFITCNTSAPVFAVFENSATYGYGAKSVIYIPMDNQSSQVPFDGVFLLAGAGGYYTSADGKHWNLRKAGNFGGLDYPSSTSVASALSYRQGAAYGGIDKKAILLPNSGNILHYTDEALNYAGTAAAVDAGGSPLRLTAIVWDEYSQKFWCGATPVNGTTFTGFSGIYSSQGEIDDGRIIWRKAELGQADIFRQAASMGIPNPTSAQFDNAHIYWLSTNQNGTFAFGLPPASSYSMDMRYCFAYFTIDREGGILTGDYQSLSDNYPVYSSDENDVWVIEKDGVTTNVKEGTPAPAPVTGGVVEPNGNILILINYTRATVGYWNILYRYTLASAAPKMHYILPQNVPVTDSTKIKHAFYRPFGGITYSNGQVVAFPNNGPYRNATMNRNDSTSDFLYSKYDASGNLLPPVKLIGDDIQTEEAAFTAGNLLINSAAAVGAQTVVVAQTDLGAKSGKIVTFDITNEDIRNLSREVSFTDTVEDQIYKVTFTDDEINPYIEGKQRFEAMVKDENGMPVQDDGIVFFKLAGSDGVNVLEDGSITFDNEPVKENFMLSAVAVHGSAPSVYAIRSIRFKAYNYETAVTFNKPQATVTTTMTNSLANAMDIYTVLSFFKGEQWVEAKFFPYTVNPDEERCVEETYVTTAEGADITAKAFVIGKLTAPKTGMVNFSHNNGVLQVNAQGHIKGGAVNLLVADHGIALEAAAGGSVRWSDFATADNGGSATLRFKPEKSGVYDVYLSEGQLSAYEKYAVLYVDKPNINLLSKSEMIDLFDAEFDYANFIFTNAFKSIANKKLIGEKFYDIVVQLGKDGQPFDYFDYVTDYVLLTEKQTNEAFLSFMAKAGEAGGSFPGLSAYRNSGSEVKAEVIEAVISASDIQLGTVEKVFTERLILSGIRYASNWTGIDDYMSLIENSKYTNNKDAVSKALVKKSFDTIDALNTFIRNLDLSEKGGSIGTGGGGRNPGGTTKVDVILPGEAPAPVAADDGFSDVPKGHWAHEAIRYMKAHNIISGIGDGLFNPDANISRAQLVKILCNAYQVEPNDNSAFEDTPAGEWYTSYVSGAHAAGKIMGDGNYFYPDAAITREDMAVMIYRFSQLTAAGSGGVFDDHPAISPYALEAVYSLSGSGIINGLGDNLFGPCEKATRAQAAAIIYRALFAKGGAVQ